MFGTSGVRGPVGDAVTAETALSVGRALGTTGRDRVVVGRDPRTSGPLLADALSAGLRETGADVVRLGLAATPTVARAVAARDADAGVSVTASHNPPADNGLKLWQPSGQAFDTPMQDAIADVVAAESYDLRPWDGLGEETAWTGARAAHREALLAALHPSSPPDAGAGSDVGDGDDERRAGGGSLEDLRVVVDVGNGAGGVTAETLHEAGVTVETLNGQPDGRFPGRPSEPTAETCASLCSHVGTIDADLGVAHDGDADRMLAVDETGSFVGGDALLALFGRAAVRAAGGGRVAVPVDTSLAVGDALAPYDGETVQTRVGDVYVAERARESDVVFGGEPSGAWIWPDETLCPDGPLAAVRLARLVATAGPLSALVAEIPTYPLRRASVETDRGPAVAEAVASAVDGAAEFDDATVTTLDGVRVDLEDGWFLIRASGTQPIVRLTAEARTDERCEAILARARALVEDALAGADADG
jgi:phosphoglucosamine mutase